MKWYKKDISVGNVFILFVVGVLVVILILVILGWCGVL